MSVPATRLHKFSWPGQFPLPDPALERLGDIERGIAKPESNPVRPVNGKDHLLNQRAVRFRIIHATAVFLALLDLTKVGEPEPTGGIKHNIVRSPELTAITLGIQGFDCATHDIHTLNTAARIIVRKAIPGRELSIDFDQFEASVVAHIHHTVRTDSGAVCRTAQLGDNVFLSIWLHPHQPASLELGNDDTAIVHRNRPFGIEQSRRDFSYFCHDVFSPY